MKIKKDKKAEQAKQSTKKINRKYDINHVRKLWMECNNKCPICGQQLIYFNADNFINGNNQKVYKTNNNTLNIGDVAHIISHSDDNHKYGTNFPIENLRGKVLRENVGYDFFNELASIAENKEYFKNRISSKTYSDKFISSYFNLVILCTSCHNKIDGSLLPDSVDVNKFFDAYHEKSNYERTKLMFELKGKENLMKKDISFSDMPNMTLINHEDVAAFVDSLFLLINKNEIGFRFETSIYQNTISDTMHEFVSYVESHEMNVISDNELEEFITQLIKVLKPASEEMGSLLQYKLIFSFKKVNDKEYILINAVNMKTAGNIDRVSFGHKKEQFEKIGKGDTNWIWNNTKSNHEKIRTKPEYKVLRDLFVESLENYFVDGNEMDDFDSFSVAYMARWGTGKTTIIRSLEGELKDFFNFVDINLWHISNASTSINNDKEDNVFVRTIVKEAITQLSNNPDLVNKYIDGNRVSEEIDASSNLKEHMLKSILQIPPESKPETLIMERAKFLDQFIDSLTQIVRIIFKNSRKPTIFIFDDLDRVDGDDNIVAILDALVAFLNIKNAIYIIPVDEAKVMKAIANKKPGIEPYSFMNKYFNYSIRAPYMPKINAMNILGEVIKELPKLGKILAGTDIQELASKTFPSTYRGVKDSLNSFNTNYKILQGNEFIKKLLIHAELNGDNVAKQLNKFILFSTAIQIKAPLLSDYLAQDIKRKDVLFELFNVGKAKYVAHEVIKGLKNDVYSSDFKEKVSNSVYGYELWSALTNLDLPNGVYSGPNAIVNNINAVIKNAKADINQKNLIIERLEYIERLFSNFEIRDANNNLRLIIWTTITMAELDDKRAQEYGQTISWFNVFVQKEHDDFKNELTLIHETDSNLEMLSLFFSRLKTFNKLGYIENFELKNIITNFIVMADFLSANSIDKNIITPVGCEQEVIDSMNVKDNFIDKCFDKMMSDKFMKTTCVTFEKLLLNERARQFETMSLIKIMSNLNKIISKQLPSWLVQNILPVSLSTRFTTKFITNNKLLNFSNALPLDYLENKNKTIEILITTNSNFDLSSVEKTFIQASDLIIYCEKNVKIINADNIKNIINIFSHIEDFRGISKMPVEILSDVEFYGFLLDNSEWVIKDDKEFIFKEIHGLPPIVKELEWVKQLSKNNDETIEKTMNENKVLDKLKKHKRLNDFIVAIWDDRVNSKDLQKTFMSKLVSETSNQALEMKYQKEIGWHKNCQFIGEPLVHNTPLSDVIRGYVNSSSEVLVTPIRMNKILSKASATAKKLFNGNPQNEKWKIIEQLIEKLVVVDDDKKYNEDKIISNNRFEIINLLDRSHGDYVVVINGETHDFEAYAKNIPVKSLAKQIILNENRRACIDKIISKYGVIYDVFVKITSQDAPETLSGIVDSFDGIQEKMKNYNDFILAWDEKRASQKTLELSVDKYKEVNKEKIQITDEYELLNKKIIDTNEKINKLQGTLSKPITNKINFEKPLRKKDYNKEGMISEVQKLKNTLESLENEILNNNNTKLKETKDIIEDYKGKDGFKSEFRQHHVKWKNANREKDAVKRFKQLKQLEISIKVSTSKKKRKIKKTINNN